MNYRVSVSPSAKAEFLEIYNYVKAEFGKPAADRLKASYMRLLKRLAKYPYQYEAVPERFGLRKCATMSPTLVYYSVEGVMVIVHRVRDGRSFV